MKKILLVIMASLYVSSYATVISDKTPEIFIKTLIVESIKTLKENPNSSEEKIKDLFYSDFTQYIDANKMINIVFKKHLNKMTETEKNKAGKFLLSMLIRDYSFSISSIDVTDIPKVELLDKTKRKGSLAIVYAKIKGVDDLEVTFKIRSNPNWKIYDVGVYGTSLIKTYKSMIKAKIRRKGFEKVLESIRSDIS